MKVDARAKSGHAAQLDESCSGYGTWFGDVSEKFDRSCGQTVHTATSCTDLPHQTGYSTYTNVYTDVELVDLYLKFALSFYINFRIIKLLGRPPLTLRAPT